MLVFDKSVLFCGVRFIEGSGPKRCWVISELSIGMFLGVLLLQRDRSSGSYLTWLESRFPSVPFRGEFPSAFNAFRDAVALWPFLNPPPVVLSK